LIKLFENDSGSAITINDVGIYNGFFNTSSLFYNEVAHCLARFQVSPADTLPDTEVARVTMTIQITV